MSRARNKTELLQFGRDEYYRLMRVISGFSADQIIRSPVFENRTVKDIVAHLADWHRLFLQWYAEGMAGGKPQIPAPGYSWKEEPELNEALYQKRKSEEWPAILEDFKSSYEEIRLIVEGHSDEELIEKQRYPWTGSTNLACYLAGTTSSHYVWANGLLKKFKKTLDQV
jgi:hypothetical protein